MLPSSVARPAAPRCWLWAFSIWRRMRAARRISEDEVRHRKWRRATEAYLSRWAGRTIGWFLPASDVLLAVDGRSRSGVKVWHAHERAHLSSETESAAVVTLVLKVVEVLIINADLAYWN